MPKVAPEVLLSVADAAEAWWASKRPSGWTVEQHFEHPWINVRKKAERTLATAVSVWVALQRGIPAESVH